MMTKKHFNEIARILKESETKEQIINRMAQFCRMENANFDMYRFKTACGLMEE